MPYIKHLSGLIFEGSDAQLREYSSYGSVEATAEEWDEYCHPGVVATVEAVEETKTDEVIPAPEVTPETPVVEKGKVETTTEPVVESVNLTDLTKEELKAKLLEVNPHFPAIEKATKAEIIKEIEQATTNL